VGPGRGGKKGPLGFLRRWGGLGGSNLRNAITAGGWGWVSKKGGNPRAKKAFGRVGSPGGGVCTTEKLEMSPGGKGGGGTKPIKKKKQKGTAKEGKQRGQGGGKNGKRVGVKQQLTGGGREKKIKKRRGSQGRGPETMHKVGREKKERHQPTGEREKSKKEGKNDRNSKKKNEGIKKKPANMSGLIQKGGEKKVVPGVNDGK